jgi:hypothetical protein
MAYKQVTNVALSTDKPKVLFQHIRDFLTATGLYNTTTGVGEWTVINSYYAVNSTTLTDNDWCLLQTTGETGVWDFRILIKVTSLGIISWSGQVWSGLSGSSPTVSYRCGLSTECIATPANWTAFYLYADKDFCAIVVRAGTTNYIHRFGIAENINPEYMAPLSILSATTSGSSKQMSVSDSSNALLAVNNRVQLLDYTTGTESGLITANDTGTDIVTIDSNTYAYTTGAKMCSLFPYVVDGVLSKSYTSSLYLMCTQFAGTGSATCGAIDYRYNSLIDTTQPNPFNQKFVAQRASFQQQNSGATLVRLPSWILFTRKRSTEEEVHTVGSDTYRYFSFFNDTSFGFLYKE